MNYLQMLWLSFMVALSQSISFKIAGKYLVTIITPPGAVPNHLNFNQALKAIQMVMANGVGIIVVGDVSLSVTAL